MYDAEEAEALAEADWAYRKAKQEGLNDTAEDIRKSITSATAWPARRMTSRSSARRPTRR